jgi:arabinogalactan oligomer/maltooligosaccharide transport system substrate-binding protein
MNRRTLFLTLMTIAILVGLGFQGFYSGQQALANEAVLGRVLQTPGLKTDIVLWHYYNPQGQTGLEELIDDFEAANPNITVDQLYMDTNTLKNIFIVSSIAGDPPALMIGDPLWGSELYDAGYISDLSTSISASLVNSLYPEMLKPGYYQGALVSLPAFRNGVVLFRNTNIIATRPNTYNQLVALAQAAAKGDVNGAYLERGGYYAAGHLYSLGGYLMDGFGCPAFNNAAGVAWVELLDSFEDAGPTDYLSNDDLDSFQEGKAGFIIDGAWNTSENADAIGAGNLAIDPWPTPLSGYVNGGYFYMSPGVPQDEQDAAAKFLAFYLSKTSQQTMMDYDYYPAVQGINSQSSIHNQVIKALDGGIPTPISGALEYYWEPLDAALGSVFDEDADPDQALQTAFEEIMAELKKRGYDSCGYPLYLPLVNNE